MGWREGEESGFLQLLGLGILVGGNALHWDWEHLRESRFASRCVFSLRTWSVRGL